MGGVLCLVYSTQEAIESCDALILCLGTLHWKEIRFRSPNHFLPGGACGLGMRLMFYVRFIELQALDNLGTLHWMVGRPRDLALDGEKT